MDPAPLLAERVGALPFFVHNLFPAIRATWIRVARRAVVADSARADVARLAPEDPVPTTTRDPAGVVLDRAGVVLGAVPPTAAGVRAMDAIDPAPQTIRPDMTPALASRLLRRSPYLVVTTADGRYVGVYPG
jgi:hypothetical protein